MEIKEKIRQFILKEVCSESGIQSIEEDEPLIDSGILDSLGILKLLSFLDEEYGIDLSSAEIKPENFVNIQTISELVEKQKGTP